MGKSSPVHLDILSPRALIMPRFYTPALMIIEPMVTFADLKSPAIVSVGLTFVQKLVSGFLIK